MVVLEDPPEMLLAAAQEEFAGEEDAPAPPDPIPLPLPDPEPDLDPKPIPEQLL